MKKKDMFRRALVIVTSVIVIILIICICAGLYEENISVTQTNEEETLLTESEQEESAESELVENESGETGENAVAETSGATGENAVAETSGATGENAAAETSSETGGEAATETSAETTGASDEVTGEKSSEEGSETQESDIDISTVTSVLYHEGGGYISDFISGISYSSVLDWLSLHREDDYYLGTPYPSESDGTLIGGSSGSTDRRNPNGDCETAYGNDDYDGEAMLNCTGFVWHVFYKASGLTREEAFDTIPCWGGVGAKDWISYLRNNGLEYKTYYGSADSPETLIAAMIADGYMETGDLIWTWGEGTVLASDGLPSKSSDPHVGIYTGTYFGGEADEWWHSLGYSTATDTFYGENLYGSITPMAPCVAMTVIKLG